MVHPNAMETEMNVQGTSAVRKLSDDELDRAHRGLCWCGLCRQGYIACVY